MMTGIFTGVKNNSSPNHLIKYAFFPISDSITSAISMKSVGKIYSPKMSRNSREPSKRKVKAKKLADIITCPSLIIYPVNTPYFWRSLRKLQRIRVYGL
jgi:hypothetical protein